METYRDITIPKTPTISTVHMRDEMIWKYELYFV